MITYPLLTAFAIAVLVIGVVAVIAALGVLVPFVVSNHRERMARHESIRSYYGRYYRRVALIH